MEKARVLIVVSGGVAESYAPEFVDVEIVDLDNIRECGEVYTLPAAFEDLATRAGVHQIVTFE